ncbi:hypothetical protein A2U01_0100180, partial [Trifolium medium]|nr:hypothetical protein [Trifolium medium]
MIARRKEENVSNVGIRAIWRISAQREWSVSIARNLVIRATMQETKSGWRKNVCLGW